MAVYVWFTDGVPAVVCSWAFPKLHWEVRAPFPVELFVNSNVAGEVQLANEGEEKAAVGKLALTEIPPLIRKVSKHPFSSVILSTGE
jgi:hypothetical protein